MYSVSGKYAEKHGTGSYAFTMNARYVGIREARSAFPVESNACGAPADPAAL